MYIKGAFIRTFSFALGVMILSDQTALAVDLNLGAKASLGLDATIGLDQSTKDFIAGLAPQIRDQILGLLKDALPLLDQSVERYLQAINTIVDKQVNHLQRVIMGSAGVFGEEFTNGITFGIVKPKPYQQIESDWASTTTGFSYNDRPHHYREVYGDFLHRATIAYCVTENTAEVSQAIGAIQDDARPRWAIWLRLENKCQTASDCYDSALTATKALMTAGDQRDVKLVDAPGRIAVLTKPAAPGFFNQLFGHFDPSDYEKKLIELYNIQDGVILAKTTRENLVLQMMISITSMIGQTDAEMDSARQAISSNDHRGNTSARDQVNTALGPIPQIESALNNAIALSTLQKDAADAQFTRINAIRIKATQIAQQANDADRAVSITTAYTMQQRNPLR